MRGVNLVGFLESESGLGEVARGLVAALRAGEVPTAAISYRRTPNHQEHRLDVPLSSDAPYDTNVICLNPDHLVPFAGDVGSGFFANRYSVGVWFWETSVMRAADRAATRFLDEIWVASEYVRRAIGPDAGVPVEIVPVVVRPPAGPFATRTDLGLRDTAYTFLFLYDFVSAERKNPAAVVEAFTRAFEPGEGPLLVLKSVNGRERKPRQYSELVELTRARRDIVVHDGYVSAAKRDSYLAACDCYVSLHRSEGFGLTLAEAMASGKPVLATGYSGNLEFMDDSNSRLVPYQLVDVPEDWWAYEAGSTWAEPDIERAAELMRAMYEDPAGARALGERARRDVLTRFSPESAAKVVADRLERARARHGAASAVGRHLADAATRVAGPVGDALVATPHAGTSGRARRWLRRALWPQLAEERAIQEALLDSLVSLRHGLSALEARVAALERQSAAGGDAAQEIAPHASLREQEALELGGQALTRADD